MTLTRRLSKRGNPLSKPPAGIYSNLPSHGDAEFSRYMRRAFLASMGFDQSDLDRPIVGIADTSSDYVTCHRQMPEILEAVKRGVLEEGGLPLAFPTSSLHEILLAPTTMLYRNMLAMETEEMIRSQPMDAVVLLGGCDKTVPAQLMAAASANLPAIGLVTGPMMTGRWRGQRLGACTDCRQMWAKHRAEEVSAEEIREVESNLCPTGGTCMVMGTASTMACLAETLGVSLPGSATPPAVTADRLRVAVATGRQAAKLTGSRIRPLAVMTRDAFLNALTVLIALSGSTNAIIHLTAIARRCGVQLTLDDLQATSDRTPLLVDCKPAGTGYMEDFHHAGGVPVLLKALEPLLDTSVRGVTGRTLGEQLADTPAPGAWQSIVRTLEDPLGSTGSLIGLKGSLAPNGAILKAAAASPELLSHTGPAVVFESPADVEARVDDPSLGITPEHVLILRNAGPVAAGMPEAGAIPIPKYLAELGVTDMVRVSDARMSGTSYGTVVLHAAPEAAAGGPLALVKAGDRIELDARERRIDLLVSSAELERRKAGLPKPGMAARGYARLHALHVMQADLGADLDFLGPA